MISTNSAAKLFLRFLLAILIVGFSIYFYLSQSGIPNSLFNADQISIPYLYQDLVQRHHDLQYWNFSYSNYLFPDTFIYFLVKPFFSDFRLAAIFSDCLILFSYFFMLIWLGSKLCGKHQQNLFLLSALLSMVLINSAMSPLFVPILTSHFCSNVVVYMVELFLIAKLFDNPKKIYYWAITVLVFLTIFSDPITTGPLVCSVLVGLLAIARVIPKQERRILLKTGVLLIIAAITSGVMTHLHLFDLHFDLYHFRFQLSLARVIILYKAFQNFAANNPIIMLALLTDLVAAVYLFFKLLLTKNNKVPLSETMFWLVLISTASCLPILFLSSASFDYDVTPGNLTLFHFIPAILLPVFLGLPMLLARYTSLSVIVNKYYFYLIFVLLGYVLLFGNYYSILPLKNYYPPIAKCLDDYYERGQLLGSSGVGDFWDAHPNEMLTKNHLTVVAAWKNYTPFDWMSTSQDYRDTKFNFIIVRTNDQDLKIRQTFPHQFGIPQRILSCPVGSPPAQATHLIYTFKHAFTLPKPKLKHYLMGDLKGEKSGAISPFIPSIGFAERRIGTRSNPASGIASIGFADAQDKNRKQFSLKRELLVN